MNENEGRKKREWVKNAAIVFLTIMLILTFFSNTIMNYSLPEVATQYVQSGSITAKVRGTGNVEATDPYNVVVKESRVISSVAVKQGDEVEKDQVLYYLEDKESDELKTAEKELGELELAYMKGLFGGTVSPEIINKVSSGRTDSFSSYQAMVTDMQDRLQAAEKRVQDCQKAVDDITLQSTINTNDATVSTIPDELEKDKATTDLAVAELMFNQEKEERVAELTKEINEVKYQIDDLETLIAGAQSRADAPAPSAGNPSQDSVFQQQEKAVIAKIKEMKDLSGVSSSSSLTEPTNTSYPSESAVSKWYNGLNWTTMGDENQKKCEALYGEYRVLVDQMNQTLSILNEYGSANAQYARLEALKDELRRLENKLAEVNAITIGSSEDAQDARMRLRDAERRITEIDSANKQTSVAFQNRLANAESALKNAQAVYELLKTEQTELAADINAELDLAKTNKDIADKKAEIAKLKENSIGATITAPVAGTVTSLAYVAGETTKPEEPAAVLQVAGKGYTLSFSVTNEQAKKVQVGDTAELQNAWYYDDVQAVLATIRPDPDNPSQNKQLTFNITGTSVQAGQSLSLSVGQRSSEYEFVVPNSAVREDNNGKFILIVESKSGPINNRYIATRVDVEVLASDDTNTAISAALYGYEYVITTSTKPVEAGKQVRLNES
ncbi:MAG: HlyD family efflux transporter periplasmic adaptor subunit [Lachnospiraceae bacterium]|jgi:multidrug efflux pump subunit AcrA (membrane-fusion protein)|nr:HlyD family efflux transporter periplasmic adaptor subunit [Lachnospiraceae bacterium]